MTHPLLAAAQVRDARLQDLGGRVGVGVIVLAVVTAFVVPAGLGLGVSGLTFQLPTLLGIGVLAALTLGLFTRPTAGTTTVRVVVVTMLAFLAYRIFSYAHAHSRVLTTVEASQSLRTLVITAGLVGLAIWTALTVDSPARFHLVTRTLAMAAYFSATIALLQRLTGFDYEALWSGIPGLRTGAATEPAGALLAGRAFGTAGHPIELAVVSSALVGLALFNAATAATPNRRMGHYLGAGVLVVACLVAISRSGFITLAIVGVIMAPVIGGRRRLTMACLLVVAVVSTQLFAHGALSTLRYQLFNVGQDQSSLGRTDDYTVVFALVDRQPWLGLGAGTYDPDQYRYLDNQWLGELVSSGIVGVLALIAVFVVPIAVVAAETRRVDDISRVGLAGTAAGLAGLAVSALFFDELSFFQTSLLVFVLAGLASAGGRLARDGAFSTPDVPTRPSALLAGR